MNNKILAGVAVVALVAGVVVAQFLQQPATESRSAVAPISGRVVEFSLPDTDGKMRNINEWQGKTIVLNFWATWCPPCREEIPLLVDTHEKFKKDGVVVIGVAIDKKEDITHFVDSFFINYPVLINEQENTRLMAQYGNRIATLPYSVIIDRNGTIVARRAGAFHGKELSDLLVKILDKSA
jgi:thiol-disulfide isomerase/thioredoxin